MKRNRKIFIISAVHDHLGDTKKLLKSITNQNYKNYEVLIVDDGSSDGTKEYITKNYPEMQVLEGDGNLWWTGSIYWGIEVALRKAQKGDFILTINNDCMVDKSYLEKILKDSESFGRAITGSLIIDIHDKNRILGSGVITDWSTGEFYEAGPEKTRDLPRNKKVNGDIDALPTKGTLYPVEVFKKVGNFDKKNLPHYISDYEFAIRAKRAGFSLQVSLSARVYNDIERTGIGRKIGERFSFKQYFELMFSRRSRINVIDHWNFIRLSCPSKYKTRNYVIVVGKLLHYLLRIYPFNLVVVVISAVKEPLGLEGKSITDTLLGRRVKSVTK